MSPSLLFQAALVIAVSVGGTYYIAEKSDAVAVPVESEVESKIVEPPKIHQPTSASVVSIPRTNGQFYTQARVNSGSVKFLIDTGASVVALTLEDARRAGINVRSLIYDRPVDTANGRTMAAAVTLKHLQIGGVRVQNVSAVVLPEGLHVSLLGMSFLGQLQKVEATPNQLILRR